MKLARRDFLRIGAGALTLPLAFPTRAQAYPIGPVRVIVGFPAGGAVDISARIISPWLAERLGQPFVVENHPGESGNLATRAVAKSVPDGSTLLICGPVNTINTSLFHNLDFDFVRDIVPVASISRVPLVVEVNPAVEARSVQEFLALAKAKPGKIKVAYAGHGTPQHVGIELFKMMSGLDLTLVPYVGSTPALADLLSGKVDAMFDSMPSSIALIRSGKLIPLAVTSPTPSEALLGIPAMANFVPGYEAGSWFGIGAPKGTPESVVSRLNQEVNAALTDPRFTSRLTELGATPFPGSSADFALFIANETQRYAQVIRGAKIMPR